MLMSSMVVEVEELVDVDVVLVLVLEVDVVVGGAVVVLVDILMEEDVELVESDVDVL